MTAPVAIQWVVFDAVGTLIFADPPVHMAYHRIGRKSGSEITPPLASQRFKEAITARPATLETSAQQELEFWKSLVAKVLPDANHPEGCFQRLWEHFAAPSSWGVYADVEETLDDLKSRGIQVAIASNFDHRLHTVMNGHRELKSITRRFISSEIGWKKPSPRFFEAIVKDLDAAPSSILMIGDTLADDVHPARTAGLQALHVNRTAEPIEGSLATLSDLSSHLNPES
ncbi:Phosphatase [Caulifigura coniformis]|uniref:Phosphatase n=1 Tax=Caulifigura coniformis TaxID=2527983 RepID=A0A517SKN6_9PLAN|nr:HAD-IA family hydrolase [Caulifigura coniformis]QDT56678.1 Phosphatase [Caulifigura coniformis]